MSKKKNHANHADPTANSAIRNLEGRTDAVIPEKITSRGKAIGGSNKSEALQSFIWYDSPRADR